MQINNIFKELTSMTLVSLFKNKNNNINFIIILVLIVFGIFWLKFIHIFNWGIDDSFFGYTYAKNLINGNGFTFNSEKILGTSAPLPVFLYAVIFKVLEIGGFKPEIYIIGQFISTIAIIFISVFMYLFLEQHIGNNTDNNWIQKICAFIGAIFVYFNLFILMVFGHETILAILFLIMSLYFVFRKKIKLSLVLLMIAFFCRAETIFILPYIIYKIISYKEMPIRVIIKNIAIILLMPIIISLIAEYVYFGQISSNSFSFKVAQDTISGGAVPFQFIQSFFSWFSNYYFSHTPEALFITIPVVCVGCLITYRSKDYLFLFISLTVAPFLFYIFIGISFYHWFLFLFAICISTIISEFFYFLFTTIDKKDISLKYYAYFIILMSSMLFLYVNAKVINNHKKLTPYSTEIAYQTMGNYLKNNTPKESTTAYLEIGQIAYFSERKIIDTTGITTKNILSNLKNGDKLFSYNYYHPNYIIVEHIFDFLGNPELYEKFNEYHLIKTFEIPYYRPVSLYGR